MNILGAEANLVMGGKAEVEVYIDGKFYKKFKVQKHDLYNIFSFDKTEENYKSRKVELKFRGEKIELFA